MVWIPCERRPANQTVSYMPEVYRVGTEYVIHTSTPKSQPLAVDCPTTCNRNMLQWWFAFRSDNQSTTNFTSVPAMNIIRS